MTNEILILITTAASVAFVHTLFGPDHYLPFIVMAKANKWSDFKTLVITTLCGLGHVGSSIILGIVGIAFGLGISGIEAFESFRGGLAAWLFIIFGLIYFIWGMKRAFSKKSHSHKHIIPGSIGHDHLHNHKNDHVHEHKNKKLTPWVLFTIFVFGPCEPLIPLFIYPAAEHNALAVVLVIAAFTVVTILTMLTAVFLPLKGFKILPEKSLERYMHAVAGGTILLSGIGIQFLGL